MMLTLLAAAVYAQLAETEADPWLTSQFAWCRVDKAKAASNCGVMYLADDCFHSSITCRPDSLRPKLVAKLLNVKPSPRMGTPTQYVLQCTLDKTDLEWTVERRYSDFRELRKVLHAFFLRRGGGARPQCFGCAWFTQTLRGYWFPRRHLLCSRSPDVINQRRVGLHQFVLLLASHTFSAVPKCTSCANTISPTVRDFFLRGASLPEHLNLKTLERALQPDNFSPVSDPSKSKIEFRKKRSVWKVLQMERPVFSKLSENEQQKGRKRRRAARTSTPLEDGWRVALEASDSVSIVSCEA
ncbi:hypothetical protein PF004_g4266 [Phytophthora fragariae]|uniref:PX domain-containing protein n=1 Tax=Phytophthora fragariae TaxID=53985 RepID=A0A6G0PJ10_9STRA|nr:hypothetical protein PF004_g4266 [Phytophthora fragariae]